MIVQEKCLDGWQNINGVWYFLNDWNHNDGTYVTVEKFRDGEMITGWLKDNGAYYYFNSDGKMKTGWLSYNGNWYFFNDGNHYDGTYVTSDKFRYGQMITGWLYDNNKWYEFNSDGVCLNP